jgi:riboflavin kinase/FMN adenylyltransferase
LGFPTANLADIPEALPPHGVYAVVVDVLDEKSGAARQLGRGVANLGVRPTLGAGASFEVHVFDLDADLYGRTLRVHLLERLREERRFSGVEELVAQIRRDSERARELTRDRTPDPRAQGAWY